ncbi:adenylate cyclase-like protein [Phanerochaete sordida]|uniref:Adenylate cyclase-like protein n=1 Tax=Phanerochaete sordida TaxID=48140 RepID=A0A9P3LD24_9APHY|nr:adenylate cyclase-like protein [Phanerochaete sordida]
MASATSSISLDNVDDFLPPQDLLPHQPPSTDVTDIIAPWLVPGAEAEQEAPPPPTRRAPFKAAITGLRHRGSDLASLRTSSDNASFISSITASTSHLPEGARASGDLKKKASSTSFLGSILKKPRSKSRLRPHKLDLSGSSDHPVPQLPSPDYIPYVAPPHSSPPAHAPSYRLAPLLGKGKKAADVPPPVPAKDAEYTLNRDLNDMEGIVNFDILSQIQNGTYDNAPSSPSSGLESSAYSTALTSDTSSSHNVHHASTSSLPNGSRTLFSNPNPFQTTTAGVKRKVGHGYDHRNISPKTAGQFSASVPTIRGHEDPSWKAPDSWAVEPENGALHPDDTVLVESEHSEGEEKDSDQRNGRRKGNKRHTYSSSGRQPRGYEDRDEPYRIRIYRRDNTYHVATIYLRTTVADLVPSLNGKMLFDTSRETHRMYLKERGRERLLAMTEKPANIVRRRLEQAGWDPIDDFRTLATEDIQYLMKFVYKSNLLGPTDDDLVFDTFESIDLAARALKTVPVILYSHADAIISLNLSRNPMLEIPGDFIQLCTNLRVLRLQNMSMKKVPQSVRHCEKLHRLDLSCNRITDLRDAALDHIKGLRSLKLQNNGMAMLPWYFPRLENLTELNISNNKFKELPDVVCRLPSLVDLDISFNLLEKLPDEIGDLKHLQKLITVGNAVREFPEGARGLRSLRLLDCRRNMISDLTAVCLLPNVQEIMADHNTVHALDLSFGPSLKSLDASHNDITQLTLLPGPLGAQPFAMVTLDISHAKLSSLDELALAQLTSLRTLKVDYNAIRALPDSIGELAELRHLSCSNNQLYRLPATIARLQNLEKLEAHNNSLEELPQAIWECASLKVLNLTSNLLGDIHSPTLPELSASPSLVSLSPGAPMLSGYLERKASSASSLGRGVPALAMSLKRLYLGENKLTEEHLGPLMLLRELRTLNLSFNHIQVIPNSFLKTFGHLEELYLSGNALTALPTEDLPLLSRLRVLYLNGNKLQSLPQELGKIKALQVLDVGSNVLKYNINNWEFDWNWNFNTNLRYLNLSGNKRLEIKPDHKAAPFKDGSDRKLADFSELKDLRVLGLMDVTTTFAPNIPDDNEDRRVRTSLSEVNNMAYGIADTLGQNLSMFDLVQPEFRNRRNEAIFAMFGRASHIGSNNRLSKWLHDNYPMALAAAIERLDEDRGESVPDAMRRSFLRLNKELHDWLYTRDTRRPSTVSATNENTAPAVDYTSLRSGASGVVLYFIGRTLYVANAGNALAVISRQGNAELLSRKHDPFDRKETERIRNAEGWVSPKGFVNDEIDISRSFGFYYLLPVVNARPDIITWELSELDEFVIIGNRGLWDFVSYQTAVDIARSARDNPMIAAQKLRDFAISYGAEGTTMIMVISVSDLFGLGRSRSRQHTMDSSISLETELYRPPRRPTNNETTITNRDVSRLDDAIPPIPPPQGHVALVFTDIRNSTHLWEANGGMQTAISYHNTLLRRQLRFCGGYEVKTEGDAFMCSFPTAMAAVWWCLTVQIQLLQLPWPLEILECEDGKEILDNDQKLIARGLSVRMGIHCGIPIPDPDPTTHRMDYLGPIVNRASRISSCAQGGQIAVSADVIREINASIFESVPRTEYSDIQPPKAVEAIRRLGLKIIPIGEVKLKGLEAPESISLVYPQELAGRHDLEGPRMDSASNSRVSFSSEQMKELALLCVRLETLTTSRVFKPLPVRKGSVAKTEDEARQNPNPVFVYGNPAVLLPAVEKASDPELTLLLDSMATRIENAIASLTLRHIVALNSSDGGDVAARRAGAGFDVRALQQLLALLTAPSSSS